MGEKITASKKAVQAKQDDPVLKKSAAAPAFALDASAAQLKKAPEEAKKEEKTTISASGTFKVTDWSDKEHTLSISGSSVYEGKGKGKRAVGTIEADGFYHVWVGDNNLSGYLQNLDPDRVDNVRITEKVGKSVSRSLNVNSEKVKEGTVYFDDGAYEVKNGKLLKKGTKKVVGTLKVISGGEGKDSGLQSIAYSFTDSKGELQEGNLMDGNFSKTGRKEGTMDLKAGEGSQIKLSGADGKEKGSKLMGFGATGGEWHEMKKSKKGYSMKSKETVEAKLKEMKAAKQINITDDEIKILAGLSQVESSGFLNVINSWDSDKMSVGFKQYTAAGKLQDWMQMDEEPWKQYGIELDRDEDGKLNKKAIKGSKGKETKAPWLKGMSSADDLRNNVWAMRFFEAGLDDKIIAKQVEKALDYAKGILDSLDKTKPGAKLYEEGVVKTILLEIDNNRPAYLKTVIKKSQARITEASTLTNLLDIIAEETKAIYKANWEKHGNGKTEAEGEEKGARLVRKVRNYFGK